MIRARRWKRRRVLWGLKQENKERYSVACLNAMPNGGSPNYCRKRFYNISTFNRERNRIKAYLNNLSDKGAALETTPRSIQLLYFQGLKLGVLWHGLGR